MKHRGRRWLAGLAIPVALLGACNGDNSDGGGPTLITDPPGSSSSTSSTSSSTTVDPQAEVKADVEAAYLAYWDAYLEIFAAPNPENPLVDQHTTGAVQRVTLEAISENIVNGTSVGEPENEADWDPRVLSVSISGADEAMVRACLVDGSLLIQNATGEVLNDVVATQLLEATIVRENGRWKVAESQIIDRREGRWSCEQ